MAEQLLDRAEVGAALEQMRGECVPEAVRVGEEPPQRARVEPPAARGEEEGVARAARQLRPTVAEVAAEDVRCLLAERHDPFLAALAVDMHGLALEVDVREVEPDRLGAPQAAGVDELDERSVAEGERLVACERVDERVDLGGLRRVGEPARAPRTERGIGDALRAERATEERSDRGQPAPGARGREPAAGSAEVGCVVGEDADVDVAEPEPALLEPAREVADVAAVRAARRVTQARALQEAVDGVLGGLHRPRSDSAYCSALLPHYSRSMRPLGVTLAAAGAVAALVACSESPPSNSSQPPRGAAAEEARPPTKSELEWVGDLERWYGGQYANSTLADCTRSLDREVEVGPTATLRAIRARAEAACRVFEASNALEHRALAGEKELFDDASAGFRRAESGMEEVVRKLDLYRADVDRPLPRYGGTADASRIHPALSAAASLLVGRNVEIRCWSAAEWRALEAVMDAGAFADIEGERAHFSAADCARLVRLRRNPGRGLGDAAAYVVLFHELEHLKGVISESSAECVALQLAAEGAPMLGVEPVTGRRLARLYLRMVLPEESPEYRSAECRSGGNLDIRPGNSRWP